EQRLDLRGCDPRGRRLLRAVVRLHQCDEPAQSRVAQARVPPHPGAARLLDRRERDDRVRRDAGRVRLHRRGRGGDVGRARVRLDGGGARAPGRLDVPVRRAPVGGRGRRVMRRVRECLRRVERNPDTEETVNVPLLDLVAQYRSIKDDVLPALQAVIESQQFVMGPPVAQLEAAVASLCRAPHAIACASGTDALLLALKALRLEPGDEVITTPFTFFATAGAIHNAGGTPVFVDVEPDTFNIDPAAVAAALTPRTRAIVPVHLYGQMAALER